eukprot:403341851
MNADLLGGVTELRGKEFYEDLDIYQVDHAYKVVRAKTYNGAMYGLGFVHARDRLWQLQFIRHLAQGRICEFGGKDSIMVDQTVRMVGISRIARAHLENLGDEDREILELYAQGINDFVKNIKIYPIEFYVIWNNFEPWTVYDSLSVQVLLQYFVSFDWFLELTRSKLTEIYDKELVDKMLPFKEDNLYFKNTNLISDEDLKDQGRYKEHTDIYESNSDLLYFSEEGKPKKEKLHFNKEEWHQEQADIASGGSLGSNCWAVHGKHTESGKPLLACDPHLMKWLQSKWYMITLQWGEDEYLMGGSHIGLPLFSYARTKYMAWGATAINPDVSDLFIEKIKDGKYLYDNEWHPLKTIREVIKVRFSDDVIMDYNFTHNGIVLMKPEEDRMDFSAWFPLEFLNQNEDQFSLRWVYAEGVIPDLVSKFKDMVLKKRNLKEIETMFEQQNQFPLNMVYITEDGDIGFHLTGLYPKRRYQVPYGSYPKKGWMPENQWEGIISTKEHPRVQNPRSGIIVSANNLATSSHSGFGITHGFQFQHRFLRITEMLQQKIDEGKKLTTQDMIDIQMDVLDYQARESTGYIVTCVRKGMKTVIDKLYKGWTDRKNMDKKIDGLLNELMKWDFKFEYQSKQAAIYLAFEYSLATYFQESKIDNVDVRRAIFGNVIFDNYIYKEIRSWAFNDNPRSEQCRVNGTDWSDNCHEFMAYVFIKALDDIQSRLGPYQFNWKLMNLQEVVYDHSPFSKSPLRLLFEEQRPARGSRRTNNLALYFYHKTPYSARFGSVIRMITDMNVEGKVVGAFDTGLEQRAGRPHRIDFLDMFLDGQYMDMPTHAKTKDVQMPKETLLKIRKQ